MLYSDDEYLAIIDLLQEHTDEPQPIGKGAFGNIYDQFKGKAKEAVAFLMRKKGGEAVGALSHPAIGEIDLVWGKEGTGKSDGYGLAKLVKYHPEVLDNLQELLSEMEVVSRSENRINLDSKTHRADVRLDWDGERKTWLMTMFEKKKHQNQPLRGQTPMETLKARRVTQLFSKVLMFLLQAKLRIILQ